MKIYLRPISDEATQSRRQREQQAVAALVREHIGPEATVAHEASGAPFIVGRPELAISISHSSTHAVIAVGERDDIFGIDIEGPRPQLLRVAQRIVSARDILDTTQPRLVALQHAWSAKEAVYKALRATALPLDDIRLDLPALRATVHRDKGGELHFRLSFRPAPDGQYIAIAHLC